MGSAGKNIAAQFAETLAAIPEEVLELDEIWAA